ncbi:MAG: selenocysteine-specific translation elongation factor [candidate division NC10 bacterium]|nr:selenocysteine-specific translation elongation factor [candidate division NC10 bacterium]
MGYIVAGTAGHIDHGKTAMVKALTGIDTDRLKEEKERGISIELGFAYLDLPNGERLAIVDVPGHERFIKTMLAGASGIDLVVLVIAADEGVMPQTREHLQICQLLHIQRGLVALTKKDLVDEEWLLMVSGEVKDFLKGTFLEGAPIIPVSALSGEGVVELKAALEALAKGTAPKRAEGIFRLPIDRVFTIKGFGTVITGTVWAGSLRVGEEVEVYPQGRPSRARRLQVHGQTVEAVRAGQRAAVNLPGIEVSEIERGNVLARPGTLRPSLLLDVRLRLLPEAPRPLKNRSRVRFHAGTSEILARVVFLDRDEDLQPGGEAYARLRLESPAVLLPLDRYVIRSYSPALTIGGGMVLDPSPGRHRRAKPAVVEGLRALERGRPRELLERLLLNTGFSLLPVEELRALSDLPSDAFMEGLDRLRREGLAVALESREGTAFLHQQNYRQLADLILDQLRDFHAREPLKEGIGKEELRSKLPPHVSRELFVRLLGDLADQGEVAFARDKVRLAAHRPALTPAEQVLKQRLEAIYRQAGLQPQALEAVLADLGADRKVALDLLRLLLDEGVLVKMKEDLFLHKDAYEKARGLLLEYFTANEAISVPAFKDLLGITRKHAIPYLEHFDEVKLTQRRGDERILLKRF